MKYNAVMFLAGLFKPMPCFLPDDLSEEWRFAYEERAAICEIDGGLSREAAEALAKKELKDNLHFQRSITY